METGAQPERASGTCSYVVGLLLLCVSTSWFTPVLKGQVRLRLPAQLYSPSLNHAVCPQVMRRYHIQDRDDYKKYNKLCGTITKLTSVLKRLDPKDATRIEMTDQLLDK